MKHKYMEVLKVVDFIQKFSKLECRCVLETGSIKFYLPNEPFSKKHVAHLTIRKGSITSHVFDDVDMEYQNQVFRLAKLYYEVNQ